ncbi:MAG: MmcQ/YjbR family DNA-binding protein [Blastocatellia bacterium]
MSKDHQLARIRAICLALPEAAEKEAWGAPTFRVRNKMFAMYMNNYHNDGRIALWLKSSHGAQKQLVAADPERFFAPPCVGTPGWIGLHLNRNTDAEVANCVREAYRLVAPRKLLALLEQKK